MLFNSFEFILLVLVTFLLFYLPPLRKYQMFILIASSFVFYSYHSPELLILLIISLLINALTSYYVYYGKEKDKKLLAIIGVVANLAILCFFKYSPLIAKTFFQEIREEESIGHFLTLIPLPIGISFYTFQGISLVVDVFWGRNDEKVREQIPPNLLTHIFRSSLFISFFPQLVAGPILRSSQFLPQIKEKTIQEIDWETVLKYIVLGYFLKMVIADNLKDITAYLQYPYFFKFSSFSLIVFLFGYSFQIFADFAGYSFIALGIGALFGYKLILNFNYPYISQSFKEYWRRWHITLYDWFNTYLFNPLVIHYRNYGLMAVIIGTLVVFSLSGIWHGASWNFGIWGLMHGAMLVVEMLFFKKRKKKKNGFLMFLNIIFVFSYITFSYIFFIHPDFDHIITFFRVLLERASFENSGWRLEGYIFMYALPIILLHIHHLLSNKIKHQTYKARHFIYAVMLLAIILNSGSPGDFIYFQF